MGVPLPRDRFSQKYDRLSALTIRDTIAAKAFLQLAIGQAGRIHPRVINVDGQPAYPAAVADLKRWGVGTPLSMPSITIHEQHPRAGPSLRQKARVASQWFRPVDGALNTIAGYEPMNIIRKGQIRWLPKTDVVGQIRFVERMFGIAA